MKSITNKQFLIFLVLLPAFLFAGRPPKRKFHGTRVYFGSGYSRYGINLNHAQPPSQKLNLLGGFRQELRIGNDYRTFLLWGAEYFIHGLDFNSYYFNPDSIRIYDKSFRDHYALRIQEANAFVQAKYLFRRGDNKLSSPYFSVAYHLRTPVEAHAVIKRKGNVIKRDYPEMKYRTAVLYEKLNSMMSFSLGWQKNHLSHYRVNPFIECQYRFGFSSYLLYRRYTPSSLYFSDQHLLIIAGIRF